jgi:hypothetical protein
MRGRQHAVAAVCLLVDGNIVWQAPKEVELSLDPPQYPLRRCEEPEVTHAVFEYYQLFVFLQLS